jgi:hypothetical protein
MWTLMSNRRKVMGKGTHSTVFEEHWRGIPVAVKRVPNHFSSNEREERALLKLNHPNVIKLLHIDSDKHFK